MHTHRHASRTWHGAHPHLNSVKLFNPLKPLKPLKPRKPPLPPKHPPHRLSPAWPSASACAVPCAIILSVCACVSMYVSVFLCVCVCARVYVGGLACLCLSVSVCVCLCLNMRKRMQTTEQAGKEIAQNMLADLGESAGREVWSTTRTALLTCVWSHVASAHICPSPTQHTAQSRTRTAKL